MAGLKDHPLTEVVQDGQFKYERVHISEITCGDVIYRKGKWRTVNNKDIKHDTFLGHSVFGDSYNLGNIPINRAILRK